MRLEGPAAAPTVLADPRPWRFGEHLPRCEDMVASLVSAVLLAIAPPAPDELDEAQRLVRALGGSEKEAALEELVELADELAVRSAGGARTPDRVARARLVATSALAEWLPCPREDHLECLSQAVEASIGAGDDYLAGRFGCAFADEAIATGRFEDALRVCERVQAFAPDEPLFGSALRASRADALRRLERFDEALVEIERAEDRLGDEPFHAEIEVQLLGLRGLIHLDEGRPYEAAEAFERESRAATALDPNEHHAVSIAQLEFVATSHIVNLDLLLERFGLAERRLQRLLGDNPFVQAGPGRAQALVQLGVALTERARPLHDVELLDEARAKLEEALPEAPPEFALTARITLADIALQTEAWERAAAQLEAARPLTRTVDSERARAHWAAQRTRWALACAADPSELQARRADLEEAWRRVQSEWLQQPVSASGIGFLHLGTQRLVLSELVRATLALDATPAGRERALDVLVAAQGLGVLTRSLGGGDVRWADVRDELLTQRSGALVWFPAMDRSHLFVVDQDGVAHAELPSRDRILELVSSFRDELTRPPRDEERRATELGIRGEALREALLPASALARLATWDDVFLVGLELIRDPPLEALSIEGTALGISHAVVRTTSLPLAVALSRRGAAELRTASLVGFPVLGPTARALASDVPLDAGPADELVSAFEGRTRTGRHATVRALRAEAARVDVLTVVAHGAFVDDSGGRPALLLAADDAHAGLVGRDELEVIRAPPLVVLLACGSARGPERLGDDGIASITGALQLAGARTVIASREDLPRDATYALASRLMAHLAAGRTPAEALRRARADVASSKDFGDPWYWGHLHAEGLGR